MPSFKGSPAQVDISVLGMALEQPGSPTIQKIKKSPIAKHP